MRVLELWRFPVKSMQGERLTSADIGPDGIDGDRRWALVDLATDSELTPGKPPDCCSRPLGCVRTARSTSCSPTGP